MGIEFTRKQYLEVWRGNRYISRHVSLLECAESASSDTTTYGDGDYEIRIGSEVFYEVAIVGLIAGGVTDPGLPPNLPPSWTGTPSPSFEDAIGGIYNLSNNTIDPEGDTLTYTLNGSSAAWPTGVSMSSAGVITATTSVVEGTTAGMLVDIDDGTNSLVTSPSFTLAITAVGSTLLYPLMGTQRIGTFNYTQTGLLADDDRIAIGLHDVFLLGGFFGTDQDSGSPGPNFISRTDTTQEILDAHNTAFGNNDIYGFTYLIQMTASDVVGSTFGDKCYAETGPNGTDWFLRNSAGDILLNTGESPGSGGFVNLSLQITNDSSGRDFCQYYADVRVIAELLDVHATASIGVGKGGMNGWWDNLYYHLRKSGADPDQNGSNNDMQDYYDPDDPAHVAADPLAVQYIGEMRASQRRGLERAEAAYPGLIIGGNSNQYVQGYSGPASAMPKVMKEFRLDESDPDSKSYTQVGMSENNNWRPTELKDGWMRSHTLWTGVSSASGGNWQSSYNNIAMPAFNMSEPAIQLSEWIVDCLQSSTDEAGGKPIWPSVPKSASAWNMHRWGMVTSWLCGSYYCCSGVIDQPTSTTGERRATPLFDESGFINGVNDYGFGAGGTKLYYKWMGAALEPVQTVARQGAYIWYRQFENAIIIINTNWDDTDPDEAVDVSLLPGGPYKRFDGDQDSVFNDGTDLVNFNMPSIEAGVYPDKAFYDAL